MTGTVRTLAVTLALIAPAGCGDGSGDVQASEPTAPSTFDVDGRIEVEAISNGKVGSACRPDGGAPRPGAEPSGVKVGADVTVTDASGEIVGLGEIELGEYVDTGYAVSSHCEVPFSVVDVPDGSEFYSVQVGDLPPERFARNELSSPVTLTAP
jgi:hypothetical protein